MSKPSPLAAARTDQGRIESSCWARSLLPEFLENCSLLKGGVRSETLFPDLFVRASWTPLQFLYFEPVCFLFQNANWFWPRPYLFHLLSFLALPPLLFCRVKCRAGSNLIPTFQVS